MSASGRCRADAPVASGRDGAQPAAAASSCPTGSPHGNDIAVSAAGNGVQPGEKDGAVRLRPHHLLCLQNFRGEGYSRTFVRRMQEVLARVRSCEPPASILLVRGADDLCAYCPHCDGQGCMSENPAAFDRLVLARTGLSEGSLLREGLQSPGIPVVSAELVRACCPGCQWLETCLKICG